MNNITPETAKLRLLLIAGQWGALVAMLLAPEDDVVATFVYMAFVYAFWWIAEFPLAKYEREQARKRHH